MRNDSPLSRREFSKKLVVLSAAGAVPEVVRTSAGAVSADLAWPGYTNAIVIDMLATAGPFNVPGWLDNPLTAAMVQNAARSGITAVNSTVSEITTGERAFELTIKNIAAWDYEFERHPNAFVQIRSRNDIRAAKKTRRLGVILGFQDTVPYADKIDRVDLFHRLGVRIVQLTYNGSNLVGDGCLVPNDGGLKPYGREIVAKLNELGALVDVSHVGWETTRQAIAASRAPIAATHSGAAAVNNVPRNKPDDILRALANRGGMIGVFMMPFLRASGQPTADDFLRHMTHCINICGEDHVGIGSDLSTTPLELTPEFRKVHADFVKVRRERGVSAPGEDENVFNYVPEFNSPRRMELVADRLAAAGHSSGRIEKILGGNWMRLLGEVWKT
ncbi:MAG TPA: membrane dipeptidase [Gemmatimonadaceae bacterium]|nr:membrane dipeptidase [Gemmatimonadaceae bacterium]